MPVSNQVGQSATSGTRSDSWQQFWNTISTIVIAFATVFNLLVSVGLWSANSKTADLARKAFEASARPYVGSQIDSRIDGTNHRMQLIATVKNYGTVPAERFQLHWRVLTDGQEQPQTKVTDNPSILFPSQTGSLLGQISGPLYDEIMAGSKTLEVVVFVATREIRAKCANRAKIIRIVIATATQPM